MRLKRKFLVTVSVGCLAFAGSRSIADEHPYTEGPVVNVTTIRTADGKFEEYMRFVDTKWKQQQEFAKQAGDVLSYQVLSVIPRAPDDPDLLLIVTYKSWAAALDAALEKSDAIAKAVYGATAASDQGVADRAPTRRLLGTTWMQVLILK